MIITGYFTWGIIKISIILFYKRIFDVRWFRRIADVVNAIIACWTIFAVLVNRNYLQCSKYSLTSFSQQCLQLGQSLISGIFVPKRTSIWLRGA